jgi:hypothetical protein
VSSFALWAPTDPGGVPGDLLFGTQRQPPLNEKEAHMVDSPSFECPFDEPVHPVENDSVDWEAALTDEVGDYDAFGPFGDRESYPGPE